MLNHNHGLTRAESYYQNRLQDAFELKCEHVRMISRSHETVGQSFAQISRNVPVPNISDQGSAITEALTMPRGQIFDSAIVARRCNSLPLTSCPFNQPVVLTLELLDALRGLPLPRAAQAVGVSATAFKKACRRLGVHRWGYRRGPGRAKCERLVPSRNVVTPLQLSQEEDMDSCCSTRRCSSGEEVDAELACCRDRELELEDWLGGTAGSAEDDALVLELLAQPWPLNPGAGIGCVNL